MKKLILIALVVALAPAAYADSLSIGNIAFGTGIENHAITGVDTTFPSSCGRLYCWTLALDAVGTDTIYHVWTHEGVFVQKVPLVVRGYRYRTNSYKTITPGLEGVWTVEVLDNAGNRLAIDSASVHAAPAPEKE